MNQKFHSRKDISLFPLSTLAVGLLIAFASGCSSSPPSVKPVDPNLRETAIFECKKNFQAKKKARFQELPPVLRRLMGDNRILREFPNQPRLPDMRRIISRFPLEGDSGGLWKSEENAHLKTVSGSLRKTDDVEMVALSFGQPGRTMTLPLASLNRTKTGLQGSSKSSDMHLRPIDDHHILVDAKVEGSPRIYALVRTYATQSFAEESKTILSDYPIFSEDFNDEACEDIVM